VATGTEVASGAGPAIPGVEVTAPGRATTGATRRAVPLACWLAAGALGVAAGLSPFDRETVAVWLVAGLLLAAAGRPAAEKRAVVLAWLPFLAALSAYDLARTLANDVGGAVWVEPQLHLERLLFLGAVPSEVLQRHLSLPPALAAAGDAVYLSHFVAPVATAAWVWTRDRRRFAVFAGTLVLVSFAAAACFVAQPTAPPWYAARQGLVEVERTTGQGLGAIGLDSVPTVLDRSQADSNPFAAIPSLHTGYAALVALTLGVGRSRRARLALAAYPAVMLFVLVNGGEHYVVDGLAVLPIVVGARWLVTRVLP
jgi:hypothetical protein